MEKAPHDEQTGNCRQRCPYVKTAPEADGIDDCSGQGLRYAEMLRHMPHVRPLCLLVKREVTWDGNVLNVPPDISERAKLARSADQNTWDALYEAEVMVRGAQMADYVRDVNNFTGDNPDERPDIKGWDLAVALEAKSFLNPLIARGLTVTEAAEHFHRMQGYKLAEEVTDRILQQQFDQQFGD